MGLALVSLHSATGDLEKAAGVVAQLRKADPENVQVLYAAFRTYSDLAGESMLSLSLAGPDSPQMHQLIAHEDTRLGNTKNAVLQYRKAIALDPRLPGVHFELAEVLNRSSDQREKQEAEQEYRTAVAQNPLDEKAIYRLGEIAASAGDAAQAYAEYSKAAALEPADADAKLGLAKILIEMNKPDDAIAPIEGVIRAEPSNALAHCRLATLYQRKGRADDAKREVDLYKRHKEMRTRLRGLYDELRIQPRDAGADEELER